MLHRRAGRMKAFNVTELKYLASFHHENYQNMNPPSPGAIHERHVSPRVQQLVMILLNSYLLPLTSPEFQCGHHQVSCQGDQRGIPTSIEMWQWWIIKGWSRSLQWKKFGSSSLTWLEEKPICALSIWWTSSHTLLKAGRNHCKPSFASQFFPPWIHGCGIKKKRIVPEQDAAVAWHLQSSGERPSPFHLSRPGHWVGLLPLPRSCSAAAAQPGEPWQSPHQDSGQRFRAGAWGPLGAFLWGNSSTSSKTHPMGRKAPRNLSKAGFRQPVHI